MIFQLQEIFGGVFPDKLIQRINQVATQRAFPADTIIVDIGQKIEHIPLLLDGAIKVMREDENGHEMLLYHVEKGSTCTMTLQCCIGQAKSEIRAQAETDTLLMMVPSHHMEEWMSQYPAWQHFILNNYQQRFNELLHTIDSIAFHQLDQRLIELLQKKALLQNSNIILVTHQDLATELHSSRVVISRLLKKLENQKVLKLMRNSIEILDM